jgi:hypothetical protein
MIARLRTTINLNLNSMNLNSMTAGGSLRRSHVMLLQHAATRCHLILYLVAVLDDRKVKHAYNGV